MRESSRGSLCGFTGYTYPGASAGCFLSSAFPGSASALPKFLLGGSESGQPVGEGLPSRFGNLVEPEASAVLVLDLLQ